MTDVLRLPEEHPAEFYIPAVASLTERRTRTLKHDDTFAVLDHHGDILYAEGRPDGLFHKDTRHLSHYQMLIDGRRPLLLGSAVKDEGMALISDLANPDLFDTDGRLILSSELIHLSRSKFLWRGACYERVSLMNHDTRPHTLTLTLEFDADFSDLFEARGQRRKARGQRLAPKMEDGRMVQLRYRGLDTVERLTELHFDPPPDELSSRVARYRRTLAPRQRAVLFVSIAFAHTEPEVTRRPHFFMALHEKVRDGRAATRDQTRVRTSNELFDEALRRSVSDLTMLSTTTPEGPYPYAGIPWFSTAFGRDAIITALEMLWLDASMARGVLHYLARHQATGEDAAADAEPGKILHEMRAGEMANLGEVPFGRYYGSVDSTPLFVVLAGAYVRRTDDILTLSGLWPNIEAAIDWINVYGDRDGDGFVEYGRKTAEGLANQGWKDSHDSIFHADGAMARAPIALVEVQGYVYAAKREAAWMARRLGCDAEADRWEDEAEQLRQCFEQAFWCDDIGTYALALDGDKKPCRVRASNAGHALFAGIAGGRRADLVAEALMTRESFSGWGIRTLAATEARYNPMSYHNGSIWPHDNALIAMGLARYGHKQAVRALFRGLFDASTCSELRRLPELFCGFPRRQGRGPVAYPVACSPQAWASATPLALLQASLGMSFDAVRGEILLDRPLLPRFLEEVHLEKLMLGGDVADLHLRRHEAGVAVTVTRRTGRIRVVTVN
ncbi:MAG TPA: amylo-alpha-1,6-glucosidase [Azospirillaceae bacterium]|nr:amylo-alpha-1,6-glucosidase [Azospirillaceae bacterium]